MTFSRSLFWVGKVRTTNLRFRSQDLKVTNKTDKSILRTLFRFYQDYASAASCKQIF